MYQQEYPAWQQAALSADCGQEVVFLDTDAVEHRPASEIRPDLRGITNHTEVKVILTLTQLLLKVSGTGRWWHYYVHVSGTDCVVKSLYFCDRL